MEPIIVYGSTGQGRARITCDDNRRHDDEVTGPLEGLMLRL